MRNRGLSALLLLTIACGLADNAFAVSRQVAAQTVIDDVITPHTSVDILIGFGPLAHVVSGDVHFAVAENL